MMADYTVQYGLKYRERFPVVERSLPESRVSASPHWLFQKNYAACDWPKQIARAVFFMAGEIKES